MLDQRVYKAGDFVRRTTESPNSEQFGVCGEVCEIVYDDSVGLLKPKGLHYGVSDAPFARADAPDRSTFEEGDAIYYGRGSDSPRYVGTYIHTMRSGRYVVQGAHGICYADTIRTRHVATAVIDGREYNLTQEQLDVIEEVLS